MTEKWLTIARAELGVRETAGKIATPRILEYFAAAGHGKIVSDETAWCSAFVNFCMERAGHRGTMSLTARSWLRWGKKVPIMPGAVGVWPRGNSDWQGHVGIVVRVIGEWAVILGGNQKNMVCEQRYKIKDALGFRWPVTASNSKTVKAQVATVASSTIALVSEQVGEQAMEWQYIAQDWSQYFDWAQKVALGLAVLAGVCTLIFKISSIRRKGS